MNYLENGFYSWLFQAHMDLNHSRKPELGEKHQKFKLYIEISLLIRLFFDCYKIFELTTETVHMTFTKYDVTGQIQGLRTIEDCSVISRSVICFTPL